VVSGFQVKLPGEYSQTSSEYSSIIQAIICGVVLISGAGISIVGPKYLYNFLTYPLDNLSNSQTDNSFGLTTTHHFAHHNGISITAHLKVIHIERAFTSSEVTSE
jgi:hypothetical protein